jgi:dTDP-4-dehydrorhamnose reductase
MADSDPITVLQFGQTGQVARELLRRAEGRFRVQAFGRAEADFTDSKSIADIVRGAENCDAVVNAVAYTAVDTPYRETDAANPINAYGRSKLAGENRIRDALPQHVILRTSWVYSPYGANFLKTMLRLGMEREVLRVVSDQIGAPTAAADIADTIYAILRRLRAEPSTDLFGTFHYAAGGRASWHDFAAAILVEGRKDYPIKARLQAIETSQYPTRAARPRNSLLDCGKIESVYDIRRAPWENGMRDVISRLAQEGGVS